jgi:hypothetical protein
MCEYWCGVSTVLFGRSLERFLCSDYNPHFAPLILVHCFDHRSRTLLILSFGIYYRETDKNWILFLALFQTSRIGSQVNRSLKLKWEVLFWRVIVFQLTLLIKPVGRTCKVKGKSPNCWYRTTLTHGGLWCDPHLEASCMLGIFVHIPELKTS